MDKHQCYQHISCKYKIWNSQIYLYTLYKSQRIPAVLGCWAGPSQAVVEPRQWWNPFYSESILQMWLLSLARLIPCVDSHGSRDVDLSTVR
jgi:hypothetical protein